MGAFSGAPLSAPAGSPTGCSPPGEPGSPPGLCLLLGGRRGERLAHHRVQRLVGVPGGEPGRDLLGQSRTRREHRAQTGRAAGLLREAVDHGRRSLGRRVGLEGIGHRVTTDDVMLESSDDGGVAGRSLQPEQVVGGRRSRPVWSMSIGCGRCGGLLVCPHHLSIRTRLRVVTALVELCPKGERGLLRFVLLLGTQGGDGPGRGGPRGRRQGADDRHGRATQNQQHDEPGLIDGDVTGR